ncbi:MAG TPA: gliding motility-associated C-terminal domain-containing protein, partial [Chitinophagales bacterium]
DSLNFTTPTQTNVMCYGASTGTISSATMGGTGTNYLWTYNSASYTPNSTTNPTNLAAGNYRQIAFDANGCRDTATFVITQPTQITFVNPMVTNVSCNGGSDGRISSTATGGTPNYIYSWSHNTSLNSPTANGLTANTYTESVTDGNSCVVSQTFTVTQPALLQLSLSATIDPCSHTPSGKIVSTVTGGTPQYQFVLLQGTTVLQINASGIFTLLDAGNYSVSLTDSKGCTTAQNVVVSARIPDEFDVTTEETSCNGSQYHDGEIHISPLSPNAPYRYSVDNGNNFSTDSVISNLAAGYYTVTARNKYGCDTAFTVQVIEPAASLAVINPNDTTIQLGDGITLNGILVPSQNNVTAYHWSPSAGLSCDDCPSPIFSGYEKYNTYSLTITYNNLCEATATGNVIVEGEGIVYIPNAFSPNGDGNNDEFIIFGKGIKYANIKVFNRWGEKVFDTMESLFATWDGTYKGALQPPAVYVYEAEI